MKTYEEYSQYLLDQISLDDVVKKLGRIITTTGKSKKCNCFFHNDKKPSMFIYNETHQYHCFSCGAHGNIFSLVMNHLNLNFIETINWLESEYPFVKELHPQKSEHNKNAKDDILSGYLIAFDVYKNIKKEDNLKLQSFAEKRQMSYELLLESEIFYADGNDLINTYGGKFKELNALEDIGLIRQNNKGYLEYYSKRIIIAFRDINGKIVGFAGRSIDEQLQPKYLFTSNLPKGNFLYRLNKISKKSEDTVRKIFLVEGPFDALRLESFGKDSVAVLGASLTQQQVVILAQFIENSGQLWEINVFMDSDEAGVKGARRTVHELCLNSITSKCLIRVIENKERFREQNVDKSKKPNKDPDEIFKNNDIEIESFLIDNTIDLFEFLMRFEINLETLDFDKSLPEIYEEFAPEQRIVLLDNIFSFLPDAIMKNLLNHYKTVFNVSLDEKKSESDGQFAIRMLLGYGMGKAEYIINPKTKTYASDSEAVMQNAIYIAKNSCRRQEPPLDSETWNRILIGADIFKPYFLSMIKNGFHQKSPRLGYYVPKKLEEYRLKSMYAHESLVMQQYMLNELLRRDENISFEQSVLAVRYYQNQKQTLYTTGKNYFDFYKETNERLASFAYQIDMSAIDRYGNAESNMFRPYQECWKSFIDYIQDGLGRFEGSTYYLVRWDIAKYYDSIPEHVVRYALSECLDGLQGAANRFEIFNEYETEEKKLKIIQWFLDELYGGSYLSPKDGEEIKDRALTGIPQGPNISSYIANIILFPMDYEIVERIRRINRICNDSGKIHVRYARYVDDMVIVSDSPEYIHELGMLIDSQLYELNLRLSSKTEEAKKLTKEEAIEWTMDKRGGLGVSFIAENEDTLNDVIQTYQDINVFDRKDGISLFKALGSSMDSVVEEEGGSIEQIISTVFRMGEVRYSDMIWFGKILIRYIIKYQNPNSNNIYELFKSEWDLGQKESNRDTLFFMKDIELITFICSVRELLLQYAQNHNVINWKQSDMDILIGQINIIDLYSKIDSIKDEGIVLNNGMILRLYLYQIAILIMSFSSSKGNVTGLESWLNEYSNIYTHRWKLSLFSSVEGSFFWSNYAEGNQQNKILEVYHYALCRILEIEDGELEQYKSLQGEIQNLLPNTKAGFVNASELLDCLITWFGNEYEIRDVKNSEKYIFTFFQLLKKELLVQIVAVRKSFKDYLFTDLYNTDGNIIFLPIVQGIQYPGLLAIDDNTKLCRADFLPDARPTSHFKWIELDKIGEITRHTAPFDTKECQALEQYLLINIEECSENDICNWIEKIVDIYPLLAQQLENEQKEEFLVIPSKKHIFVYLDAGEQKIRIITYKTEKRKTMAAVAINAEYQIAVPTPVRECGKELWQSGMIIEDTISLNKKKLWLQQNGKDDLVVHIEFLEYIFRRLSGKSSYKANNSINQEKSFKATVKRILDIAKRYIEGSKNRKLYLFECKVLDSYISHKSRMSKMSYKNDDLLLFITNWTNEFIENHQLELIELFDSQGVNTTLASVQVNLRRTVGAFERIASRIQTMVDETGDANKLEGIQVLIKGLRASAVILTMRTQALEQFFVLSEDEKKKLNPATQLTKSLLDLEAQDSIVFYNSGENEIGSLQSICGNLLQGETESKLRLITPIGWWLILAWLMNLKIQDKGRWDDIFRTDILSNSFIKTSVSEAKEEKRFPFENIGDFFEIWNLEHYENWTETLRKIDKENRVIVYLVRSEFFNYYVKSRKIHIESGDSFIMDNGKEKRLSELNVKTTKPDYYFSYFSFRGHNISVEKQQQEYIFTETLVGNTVIGVSAIENSVSQLVGAFNETIGQTDNTSKSEEAAIVSTEEPLADVEKEGDLKKGEENKTEKTTDKNENKKIPNKSLENILKRIENYQEHSWENRADMKEDFKSTDRIALFQFDIDSTYYPPKNELCTNDGKKLWSCAEFRRWKLIGKALELCATNKVDILLLPEYSVRPDTVKWIMKKMIEEKHSYHFSVWAGTFRIFPGYDFSWNNENQLSDEIYYYTAVLPIICNTSNSNLGNIKNTREIHTILNRFKRYPAVALNEIINPGDLSSAMFEPAMKKNHENFLFADARDDVTELICAELFMINSPSNANVFCKRAAEFSSRFGGKKFDMDTMKEKMREDIGAFGDATSLNRTKNRYGRTPIVLVPACTTRAVDYYLNAQANFLAAGLTTVLCNAVMTDGGSNGGSCFIGQSSWDDHDFVATQIEVPRSTIYHGSEPGVFQQSIRDERHGALGPKEQALVICDINPHLMKGKPNPESMTESLSLVAHIPFIEVDLTSNHGSKKCRCGKRGVSVKISELHESCTVCERECTEFGKLINNLSRLVDYIEKQGGKIKTTAEDKRFGEVCGILKNLGEICQSPGLIERGKKYSEAYDKIPYSFPSPTVLDFAVVEIDYDDMDVDNSLIVVPSLTDAPNV